MDLSPFNLAVALDTALVLVRERATRQGITLGLTVDERLGDGLADERKVKQILLDRRSNAVTFTTDGGRITPTAALAMDCRAPAAAPSHSGDSQECGFTASWSA